MKRFLLIKLLVVVVLFCFNETAQAALSTPSLSSPISNITLKRVDGFLTVSSVSGATAYEFQYDTLSTFNSPHLRNETTTGTNRYIYTQTLLFGKKYFWRARAMNSTDTSKWSNPNNFTVFTDMELNYPSNGFEGFLNSVRAISVITYVPGKYIFEMDTTADLSSPNKIIKESASRFFIDSNFFDYGKTIYWRATLVNEYGDSTKWSPIWKYTISNNAPIIYKVGTSYIDPEEQLSWPSLGAAEVELYIDTNRNFNSPFFEKRIHKPSTLRDTLREMFYSQRYYWKLRAKFDDKYSPWSEVDSFVVDEGFRNLFPDNNDKIQSLITYLSWRNRAGADYQVQLGQDTFFKINLLDTFLTNNTFNVPDTLRLNQVYFWRVRSFHAQDTSEWSQIRFRTFTGQIPLGPPYNNAKDQPVHLTLRFRNVDWAHSYFMEVDTGKAFNDTLSTYGMRLTEFTYQSTFWKETEVTVKYGTDHVYRVFAIRDQDTTTEALVYTFKTKDQIKLNYPPNNMVGIGIQTNALIEGITGSDSVLWELDTVPSFNSSALISGASPHIPDDFQPKYVNLEWPGELNFETKYYWRVRCKTDIDTSSWSEIRNFTTTQVPWHTSPANKAKNQGLTPTLKWGIQGSPDDYTYQYQLSTDSNFVGATINSLSQGSTSEVKVSCDYEKTYYWRVRAYHSKDTSSWSVPWSFTTLNEPQVKKIVLSAPANGSKNISLDGVNLLWVADAAATSYEIQVARDADFTQLAASGKPTTAGVSFTNLTSNTTYYWKVRGIRGSQQGNWSTVWNFTTRNTDGVAEVAEDALQIYPNPATDVVFVKGQEVSEIQLFSTEGKLLKTVQNAQQISVGEFSGGVYYLRVRSGEVFSHFQLLIE